MKTKLTQFRLNEIQKEFLKSKSPDKNSLIAGLQKIMNETGYEQFKDDYMNNNIINISMLEVANQKDTYCYSLMVKNIPIKSIMIKKDHLSIDKNGNWTDENKWLNTLQNFFEISKDDPREIILSDYGQQIWSNKH